MQRQYVHLSETVEQATVVGKRKDKHPVVLTIATDVAQSLGVVFYRADSAIWLADPIPAAAVGLLSANEYDMYQEGDVTATPEWDISRDASGKSGKQLRKDRPEPPVR